MKSFNILYVLRLSLVSAMGGIGIGIASTVSPIYIAEVAPKKIRGIFYFMKVQGMPILILVLSGIAVYAMSLAPVTWVVLSGLVLLAHSGYMG